MCDLRFPWQWLSGVPFSWIWLHLVFRSLWTFWRKSREESQASKLLKMEAVHYSRIPVNIYQSIWQPYPRRQYHSYSSTVHTLSAYMLLQNRTLKITLTLILLGLVHPSQQLAPLTSQCEWRETVPCWNTFGMPCFLLRVAADGDHQSWSSV